MKKMQVQKRAAPNILVTGTYRLIKQTIFLQLYHFQEHQALVSQRCVKNCLQ